MPSYTSFNSNVGLPSNTIYDINQDENGFIWIATDYGLSKFDGLTFKNYTIADGLPDNEILNLFKDSQDRMWLLGFNGKIGYIQNEKIFNSENNEALEKLKFNIYISDIFEDSKHNIWFFETLNSIKKLDTNNNATTFKLNTKPQSNSSKKYNITEDINGTIKVLKSVTTKDNFNTILSTSITDLNWQPIHIEDYDLKKLISIKKNRIEAFKNLDSVSMRISNETYNFFKDKGKDNLLYKTFPYNDSYIITNLNTGTLLINSNKDILTKQILSESKSTVAFVDSEKNIWIGTYNDGLFLFPNLDVYGTQFKDQIENDLYTINLFEDNLITGNSQSEVFVVDKENLKLIKTLSIDKNPKRIRQLKKVSKTLVILSDYSLHRLNSKIELKRINNMYDSNFKKSSLRNFKDFTISDKFMYTANANGTGKIDRKNNSVSKIWGKRSTAILIDSNKKLWIGTTTGLFYKDSDTIKKYNLDEQFNNSIIYSLVDSKKGVLIGSNSYGLGILKDDNFTTISTKDGLLSNYIKSIFVDENNIIWLSTNFGLNSVHLDTNNQVIDIKSYTTSDGLYSNDVRASIVDKNKVYVATSKGLNVIDLSIKCNTIAAPITHINSILLNNEKIEKIEHQKFKHTANNFQFTYSGISFKSLGSITFKYRLKGLESNWITTKTNTVRYSSLPPNNYSFELIAISKDHQESTPISFSFTIKPPFYITWWFISLITITLVGLIAYYINYRNLKIKRQREIEDQISSLRYQALNAQMNPHFINNLLVNIQHLADIGEIQEVKSSLDKFAELVNLILESTKSNLINLNDEIKMTTLYLELQKLRFNKNTNYTIETKTILTDLNNILLPPMILQPIIENCFKHGFKNGNSKNIIKVDFKILNNDFLMCEITDNGSGIPKLGKNIPISKNSGISFSNINERLSLINESKKDKNLVFISNLRDEFDKLVGLKVTLKIPLIRF
jgi:sensor histidine kinase YesM